MPPLPSPFATPARLLACGLLTLATACASAPSLSPDRAAPRWPDGATLKIALSAAPDEDSLAQGLITLSAPPVDDGVLLRYVLTREGNPVGSFPARYSQYSLRLPASPGRYQLLAIDAAGHESPGPSHEVSQEEITALQQARSLATPLQGTPDARADPAIPEDLLDALEAYDTRTEKGTSP